MDKSLRFGMVLSPAEKYALVRLAEVEGGLSQAAIVRRLIRRAALQCGFWPPPDTDEQHVQMHVDEMQCRKALAQTVKEDKLAYFEEDNK